MMALSEQRKAIIAGAITGLTFFYTSVPDPAAAVAIDWLRFAGEFITVTLAGYYVTWVAPNESPTMTQEDLLRELLKGNAADDRPTESTS